VTEREPPIIYEWMGDTMTPLPRFRGLCDRHFVVGGTYSLVETAEASTATRNHFFAALHDAWQNLPEQEAARFPTPEALRKYALIQCGYRDERSIVCASKADALRVGTFVRPFDEYAVVIVREAVVLVLTAKSQSAKAMGKDEFQKSKSEVLDFVAAMIHVSPAQLAVNAGQSA
jgi:hypothetical protein